MMKIGLVGCGNIGADLCIALQKGIIPAEIVALYDLDRARAELLQRSFQLNVRIGSLEETVAAADFVVECAVANAVPEVLRAVIAQRRACLIMSVGGLMANMDLLDEAKAHNVSVRIPSGALCGLDGVRAAMEAGLHTVTLTTRKPPAGLAGAPHLAKEGIDLEQLTQPQVIFDGNALEAVKAFPANVNVAAALSLAGIGPKETRVRVIADPNATGNIHEVEAEGAFGRLHTVTSNLPSPRNAKSSYLASLSAAAELRAAANEFVARAAQAAVSPPA